MTRATPCALRKFFGRLCNAALSNQVTSFSRLDCAWHARLLEQSRLGSAQVHNGESDDESDQDEFYDSDGMDRYWRFTSGTAPASSFNFSNHLDSGSTATAVLVDWQRRVATFAHVGDSTGVLVNADGSLAHCTANHNSLNAAERHRIEQAGGTFGVASGQVGADGARLLRLANRLGVTRALGNLSMEHTGMSREPEINSVPFRRGQTLVIASDGVWDVINTSEAGQRCGSLRTRDSAQMLAARLRNDALTGGSSDNVSVVVCQL